MNPVRPLSLTVSGIFRRNRVLAAFCEAGTASDALFLVDFKVRADLSVYCAGRTDPRTGAAADAFPRRDRYPLDRFVIGTQFNRIVRTKILALTAADTIILVNYIMD